MYYIQEFFQWYQLGCGPRTAVDDHITWIPRSENKDAHELAERGKAGTTKITYGDEEWLGRVGGLHVSVDGGDGGCGIKVSWFDPRETLTDGCGAHNCNR